MQELTGTLITERPITRCPACGEQERPKIEVSPSEGGAFLDGTKVDQHGRRRAWHAQIGYFRLHCTTCDHRWVIEQHWDNFEGERHYRHELAAYERHQAELRAHIDQKRAEARSGRESFGSVVRQRRIDRGLSMKTVADTIGLQPAEVSAIERGVQPPPTEPSLLRHWARALALPEDDVLRRAGVSATVERH